MPAAGGTIALRSLWRNREWHGDHAVRESPALRYPVRPQSTKGIAEPRRAALLARFAARPRYDFLTAPTGGASAALWRTSIASLRAAHARYIEDARTKAGLQEVRKNC